jgi:hypothetical protein
MSPLSPLPSMDIHPVDRQRMDNCVRQTVPRQSVVTIAPSISVTAEHFNDD